MHHNPVTMGLGYSETYASNWVNCLERLPSDYSQLAFSVFNFDLLLLWNKKYKISVIALPIGPTAWLMLPPFCWPAACECRNSFQDELPKAFLFSPTLRFISFFVFFCCFILLNTSHVVNFVTLLLALVISPVLTATGFVNGRGQLLTPTESTSFDRSPKNLLLVIMSATPTAVENLVQLGSRGLLGKCVKYNEFFIYLFIPFFTKSPTGQTLSTDFHAWRLKRRGLAQGCAFGGFRWYCSSFWRWNTPNPSFWGVNSRFQAKRAKYWKFHVIEITSSILNKFGITIETVKWSSWIVPIGTQQIQDGGRPPFWKKNLNRHISATVRPILMKYGMMTHIVFWQWIYR